ncbi:hypothetical protein NW754_006838 [Fusarium falciforme]|nr:hypothetical protein NW754_006838 [Fusarium falciforme]
MEPLRLKPRQPVEADIEDWDDDDFVVEGDDLTFRSPSTATNVPSRPSSSRRRDSGSSHFSFRSELEGEEEKHVHIPGDDEKSTRDAIAAAQNAGIPLPSNVPSSALMGGTIKRLGGRKIRKIIQDDWENDMELPDTSQGFKIKKLDQSAFPESLRQVSIGSSSTQTSPGNVIKMASALDKDDRRESIQSATSNLSAAINLDRFKDAEEDDDFFGDGGDTIRVSKSRQPKPVSFITPPTPQKETKPTDAEDDFEMDLELPSDGKLKLSTRKDIPKTPLNQSEDLDWGESSLGTRYGGTRRDARSARSSSASALSPSVSSSITAESEDETFDGLVLPPDLSTGLKGCSSAGRAGPHSEFPRNPLYLQRRRLQLKLIGLTSWMVWTLVMAMCLTRASSLSTRMLGSRRRGLRVPLGPRRQCLSHSPTSLSTLGYLG